MEISTTDGYTIAVSTTWKVGGKPRVELMVAADDGKSVVITELKLHEATQVGMNLEAAVFDSQLLAEEAATQRTLA